MKFALSIHFDTALCKGSVCLETCVQTRRLNLAISQTGDSSARSTSSINKCLEIHQFLLNDNILKAIKNLSEPNIWSLTFIRYFML